MLLSDTGHVWKACDVFAVSASNDVFFRLNYSCIFTIFEL